jgi:putative transposase
MPGTAAGRGAVGAPGVVSSVSRNSREIVEGGIYHVFARGNDRRPIFLDDTDRYVYLAILSEVCARCEWARLAYCLMGNHLHLLLETPLPNLSDGMHRLQCKYAKRFNRRHGRSGHLFQERFGSNRVSSDKQFVTVTRYIANNPVEAGLCETPEEWLWRDWSAARQRFNRRDFPR